MKRSCLPLLLLVSGAMAAEPAPERYLSRASGSLEIAADGSVRSVDIRSNLGLDVVPPLEAMIRKWKFEPRPDEAGDQLAKVDMDLMLAAEMLPATGKIRIGFQQASFFDVGVERVPLPDKWIMTSPRYPNIGRQRPVGAHLLYLVQLDAEGKVQGLELREGWLMSRKPLSANQASFLQDRFEKSVRDVVGSWSIPDLVSDGHCALVPVAYSLSDNEIWSVATELALPEPGMPADCYRARETGRNGVPVSGTHRLLTPLNALFPRPVRTPPSVD